MQDPVITLEADSNTSDLNDFDDSEDSSSLCGHATNHFNSFNINLSEGERDESVQHTTTCTATSNLTPNCTNKPPPPLSPSNISSQLPHEPLEISTTLEGNQDSGDNTPTPTPVFTNSDIAPLYRSITIITTTSTPTTSQLNTVTQLSQDSTISSVGPDMTNTVS